MDSELETILARYPATQRDNLIAILQEIQEEKGFLSRDSILRVSRYLHLPVSKIFGIATFYDQFRFEARGKFHVQVCQGTACHIMGSATVLQELEKQFKVKDGQTSRDGKFSIETVGCMGACSLSPVICVNGEYHDRLSVEKIKELANRLRKTEI
jgi:NADH-quinone oxidoreductase E subunit